MIPYGDSGDLVCSCLLCRSVLETWVKSSTNVCMVCKVF